MMLIQTSYIRREVLWNKIRRRLSGSVFTLTPQSTVGIGFLCAIYGRPKMRSITVSICHYLTSSTDTQKPHTAGKIYKLNIAITCKDVVKSWVKRPLENVNSLQIEIYGVKGVTGYPDTPAIVSSKFRLLILYAMRAGCDIALIDNGSNSDERILPCRAAWGKALNQKEEYHV